MGLTNNKISVMQSWPGPLLTLACSRICLVPKARGPRHLPYVLTHHTPTHYVSFTILSITNLKILLNPILVYFLKNFLFADPSPPPLNYAKNWYNFANIGFKWIFAREFFLNLRRTPPSCIDICTRTHQVPSYRYLSVNRSAQKYDIFVFV